MDGLTGEHGIRRAGNAVLMVQDDDVPAGVSPDPCLVPRAEEGQIDALSGQRKHRGRVARPSANGELP